MGDAMRTEQGALASAQLEAFHESFNFCIDCRQYTCLNCWNDDAGRCRTCVPMAGTDDLADARRPRRPGHRGAEVDLTDDVVARIGLEMADHRPPGRAEANGQRATSWARRRAPGRTPPADARRTIWPRAGDSRCRGFVASRGAGGRSPRRCSPSRSWPRSSRSRVAAELEARGGRGRAERLAEVDPRARRHAGRRGARRGAGTAEEPSPTGRSSRSPSRCRGRGRAAPCRSWPGEARASSPSPSRWWPRSSPSPGGGRSRARAGGPRSSPRPERRHAHRADQRDDPALPDAGRVSRRPGTVAAQDDSPELAARRAQLDGLGLDGAVQPELPAVTSLPLARRRDDQVRSPLRARQRFWEARRARSPAPAATSAFRTAPVRPVAVGDRALLPPMRHPPGAVRLTGSRRRSRSTPARPLVAARCASPSRSCWASSSSAGGASSSCEDERPAESVR